jgi:hypothetical protein
MAFISPSSFLWVSGVAEAHKLLAIANLNGPNGNFVRLLIEHDDFERRFGLVRLRLLCFHSHLVESNRSVSLDPKDTPRTIFESSHPLGGIRGVPCHPAAFLLCLQLLDINL